MGDKLFFGGILVTIVAMLSIMALGLWAISQSKGPKDGLYNRVDAKTGCEYLETSRGGITPRLDATGKHICRSNP